MIQQWPSGLYIMRQAHFASANLQGCCVRLSPHGIGCVAQKGCPRLAQSRNKVRFIFTGTAWLWPCRPYLLKARRRWGGIGVFLIDETGRWAKRTVTDKSHAANKERYTVSLTLIASCCIVRLAAEAPQPNANRLRGPHCPVQGSGSFFPCIFGHAML